MCVCVCVCVCEGNKILLKQDISFVCCVLCVWFSLFVSSPLFFLCCVVLCCVDNVDIDELCQLQSLEYLFLYNNKISELPQQISQLNHLKGLHLQGNQLESE